MRRLASALVASSLALSGSALLVTGCGGSGGGSPDASSDSMGVSDTKPDTKEPIDTGTDTGKPHKDGGSEGGTEGGGCETFPAFVINLVQKETNNTSSPVAIPTCGGWDQLSPTGTAKASTTDPQSATEFKSITK
jgi:hypothetical protein